MEDKPIFDHGKADLGIQMVCEQFDKLGLTLYERWWVCYHIAVTAAAMLGKNLSELAATVEEAEPGQGSTQ